MNFFCLANGDQAATHHKSPAFFPIFPMSQVSNKNLKGDEKLNCQSHLLTENREPWSWFRLMQYLDFSPFFSFLHSSSMLKIIPQISQYKIINSRGIFWQECFEFWNSIKQNFFPKHFGFDRLASLKTVKWNKFFTENICSIESP